MRGMGFEVKFPRNLWPGSDYLADTDSNRALEFHNMWADSEVDAIMALRGGFGCLRMLPFVDCEQLNNQKKYLIGFSDISILHSLLFQKHAFVSLHGPTLSSLSQCDPESLNSFRAALVTSWQKPLFFPSIEILRGGDTVLGPLLGGNLCSIVSMLATPFAPNCKGAILFLEDIGEPLYKIDRMLTQLAQSGQLLQASAILLGNFSPSADMDRLQSLRFHEAIWKRVLELTGHTTIPVWGNFPIGHGIRNITLPHGALAKADSCQGSLTFLI